MQPVEKILDSHPYPAFLGVGKNFRLLMQSRRFFLPTFQMKISSSSKTVHTIFMKFCTVILTPNYGPIMFAISSNSYDWDWSESEGKRPKSTPLAHMRLLF